MPLDLEIKKTGTSEFYVQNMHIHRSPLLALVLVRATLPLLWNEPVSSLVYPCSVLKFYLMQCRLILRKIA